ncbi:MAG: hypothetical protein U1E39_15595 [Planctomycetota bacterium]
MALWAALPPTTVWATQSLALQLRSFAWVRAGLAAAALVLVGRVFDVFAFTPDPVRAGLIGCQTGAFVGLLWAVGTPAALGAYRDPDDGWSASLRSSSAGAGGLWWGAWAAQFVAAGLLLGLSVLSTIVFSMLLRGPVSIPLAGVVSAALAIVLPGLVASAVASMSGGAVGAIAGVTSFVVGQVGEFGLLRAFAPPPVTASLAATDVLRAAATGIAAIGVAIAGLRRLRL